ncbi:hypothetical protein QBC33DRAFT_520279 [Phialemonium atrogriseum]|uniref:Uncharacterized protein n=1 Tax=Phialemonium atrogriseum TaxID=1093897 RepID=A0AAJ0BP63_9PEZI|nr:uncharacterized protein QBC33DRAFT_520279 [Phialemonium atrogriseum]KAK1761620.1 hypothetical protein QBC33DRAFT_520279 [Phialemonium atrogriseum]
MTGDSVNNGPRLQAANIGIAIRSSSDIAIKATNMVLLDSFSSIGKALQLNAYGFIGILETTFSCDSIQFIFNATPVAYVSFVPNLSNPVPNPMPVIMPIVACIGKFRDNDALCCYMHGYVLACILRVPDHCSGGWGGEGVLVYIAATYNYCLAVLHRHAELRDPVADQDKSLWVMELIINGIVLRRWENMRILLDNTEIASIMQRDLFY